MSVRLPNKAICRIAPLIATWSVLGCLPILMIPVANSKEPLSAPGASEPKLKTWDLRYERTTTISAPFVDEPQTRIEDVRCLLNHHGYVLIAPKVTWIYNSNSQRLVSLIRDAKEFTDLPIHGLVWFRANEVIHRNALCYASEAANMSLTDMEPCSKFELETLFSISLPQNRIEWLRDEPFAIEKVKLGNEYHFQYKGRTFVLFEPSEHHLSMLYADSLRKFLALECSIHPEIRQQIVEIGMAPAKLKFIYREEATETHVEYTLKKSNFLPLAGIFDRPIDYRLSDLDDTLRRLLTKLESAEIPSPAELQREAEAAIDSALQRNHKLEAVLAAQRYFHAVDDGIGYRILLQRCGGTSNPEVRRILYDLGSIRKLRDMRRQLEADPGSCGYLLDYLIADMAMTVHDQEINAKEHLIRALEADVFIPGAFVDLWRIYMAEWDIQQAWLCIDAARKIAPYHSNLDPIDATEKKLEADFPDYF